MQPGILLQPLGVGEPPRVDAVTVCDTRSQGDRQGVSPRPRDTAVTGIVSERVALHHPDPRAREARWIDYSNDYWLLGLSNKLLYIETLVIYLHIGSNGLGSGETNIKRPFSVFNNCSNIYDRSL